jgi:ABC-type bacteriocin/lantibiotic exporter with double-glycine peptidase domain
MKTYKKVLRLLTINERKYLSKLLIMIIIMAFLDTIGIASVLPFITVLTDPSAINTNLVLNNIFKFTEIFGVQNKDQFLIILGSFVFLLLIFSLSVKALTAYMETQFIHMCEFNIGKRLLKVYLHQSYAWFLNQHSADLGKTILSEVDKIVSYGLKPLIQLVAKSIIVFAIITLLILVDTKLTVIVVLIIGLIYFLVFYNVRNYLKRIGEERLKSNQLRFKVVSECFSAVKEIKISAAEEIYIKYFSNAAKIYAKTQVSQMIISQMPRYVLEATAFGGVLLIIFYIMIQTGNFNNSLPFLSLFLIAAYRLIPAIQQIYSSFSLFSFIGTSIDKLFDDMNHHKANDNNNYNQDVVEFNKEITLSNINYIYPNASLTALEDISLSISAKSCVGIIGTSGSGKTTLVDIILGLLEPIKGTFKVDGKDITKQNLKSWQSSIGYVPQNIYLSDNTIEENIAFGVSSENINHDMVRKVSKIANLHQFVADELPKQYKTMIGERGVRLSGGQGQRIGIARALYHNPKLLILDEATNALDNETEKAVMDAINNLQKKITIIIIAHRVNTLSKCDVILKIKKGRIVEKKSVNA